MTDNQFNSQHLRQLEDQRMFADLHVRYPNATPGITATAQNIANTANVSAFLGAPALLALGFAMPGDAFTLPMLAGMAIGFYGTAATSAITSITSGMTLVKTFKDNSEVMNTCTGKAGKSPLRDAFSRAATTHMFTQGFSLLASFTAACLMTYPALNNTPSTTAYIPAAILAIASLISSRHGHREARKMAVYKAAALN